MNQASLSTESSVAQAMSGYVHGANVSEIPIYNILNNSDDVETLKSKMKFELGEEEMGFDELTKGVLCSKYMTGHELSMSLPNLSAGTESESLNKMNEKNIRSSLTNIYDKPEQVDSQTANKTSSSDLAKATDLVQQSEQTVTSVHDESRPDSVSPTLVRPLMGNAQELTISVNKSNNRLSAVLENIPLLYIPHTKQLISCIDQHSVGFLNVGNTNNNDKPTENVPADSPSSENRSAMLNGTVQREDEGQPSDTFVCNGSEMKDEDTSLVTPQAIVQDSHNGHYSGCEVDCNVALLSQDSDTSSTCQSDHTVIHTQQLKSKDAKSVEFDEISLDRLSKLSIERDSPRNTLKRTNTIGSLSRTDASSFSSISSISTGTDFSVSAASCGDDFTELKASMPLGDTDEAGFMEVNLHSRNSYERSRNSAGSQDSGIDEKCQGAKPKLRGITGFLAR